MDLLEREGDLRGLGAAFDAARSGRGCVALVSGEAGIGKTSLVEHFAGRYEKMRICRGYCDPLLTPSPLGPLYDIARQLDSGLLARLDQSIGSSALFSTFLSLLQSFTTPTILVLEDIHWADAATLDLIKYLNRRLDSTAVLLIATFRDDEMARNDHLKFLLGDLANSKAVHRFHLARLSRGAVAILAEARFSDVEALYRQTAGNPFFVTEVISSPVSGVPVTVRDAVLARAARLGPDGRNLLDLVAIIGPRVEYQMLEQFPEIAELGLSECLAVGILHDTGRAIAFRHELTRNAVLERIDPLHRRALYRRVLAGAIKAGLAGRGQSAQLAHYAEGAGDASAVNEYGLAAAKAAAALGAHREAAAHYAGVLRFAEDRTTRDRAQYFTLYAQECAILDHLAASVAAYEQAIRLWSETGDRLKQGEALAAIAWPLVRNGMNAAADRASREAIALLETLGPTRQLADAYRTQAHLRMLDRDRDGAVEIGRRAIELATALQDDMIVAASEMVVGAAMLVTGDDEGRPHLDRCLAISRDKSFDELVALAHLNIGSSYGEQYRFAQAEEHLKNGLAFAEDHDLDHSAHYMSAWLALTYMYQGRWSEAADLSTSVLAQPELAAISRIMALVALGRVRTRRGDPGAAEALDEALALARQTGTLQRLAPAHAARAELAWLAGDRDRAASEARAVFDLAVRHRHAWHTGELLLWRARAGDDIPDCACDWAARPFALQIAGNGEGAAAEWRRLGCPFEEARALAEGDLAAQRLALEIFDRLGANPAAAVLRQRMRTAGIKHIPRGARESTRRNSFGLTNRELATLHHLEEGLSNSQIAAKLFISPKTVDHHVSAILQKLGASSRREAAAIVAERQLVPQNGDGSRTK